MDEPGIDLALARQRLLDAADELFYRQGMHRVSIDRVVEKAGVPAETLREAFGSTDELVRAYLRARHTRLQDALARDLPGYPTPRDRPPSHRGQGIGGPSTLAGRCIRC